MQVLHPTGIGGHRAGRLPLALRGFCTCPGSDDGRAESPKGGARAAATYLSGMSRFACLMVLLLTSASGCGEQNYEAPDRPDLTGLQQLYEHPDGSITEEDASWVFEYARLLADRLNQLAIREQFELTLAEVTWAAEPATRNPMQISPVHTAQEPVELDGEGHATVTRLCDGWDSSRPPESANGYLRLHVRFTDEGLDPFVWGEVSRCRYVYGEHSVELDGNDDAPSLRALFPGARLDLHSDGLILVSLDVVARVDAASAPLLADFRISLGATALEIRIPVPDGSVIASVSNGRLEGIRTRSGWYRSPNGA